MIDYRRILDLADANRVFLDTDYVEGDRIGTVESVRYTGAQMRAVEKAERIFYDNKIVDRVGLSPYPNFSIPSLANTHYLEDMQDVIHGLIILDDAIFLKEDKIDPGEYPQYFFYDKTWKTIHFDELSGVPNFLIDAPSDGVLYGRKDGIWFEVPFGAGGEEQDPFFTTWLDNMTLQIQGTADQITVDPTTPVDLTEPRSWTIGIHETLLTDIGQGVTAYSWGDHSIVGYLLALPDHNLNFHSDVTISEPGTGQLLLFNGTAWVNWTPDFLTSFAETDPVFNDWLNQGHWFLIDAPSDGSIYGRKDGAWTVVSVGLPDHGLADHTDVTLTSLEEGDLFLFNGTAWVNWTPDFLSEYTETDPTVPAWVKSITQANIDNWNEAYSWGDHSLVGYLTELPAHAHTISGSSTLLAPTSGSLSVTFNPYTSRAAARLYTGTTNPVSSNRLNYDGYFYATRLYDSGARVLTALPAHNLSFHSDVTITSPVTNQLLKYTGTAWVNWTPDFLSEYTETDPTVPAWVKSITQANIDNWNEAYSWGDHSLVGYLTSYTETDPVFNTWLDLGHWFLTDAPSNGNTYGRKDGAWAVVPVVEGSKWTASGDNIYRNSRVAIGKTPSTSEALSIRGFDSSNANAALKISNSLNNILLDLRNDGKLALYGLTTITSKRLELISSPLRFYYGGTGYTQLVATSTDSNLSFTLPNSLGTSGYAMITDGNGVLDWGVIPSTITQLTAGNSKMFYSNNVGEIQEFDMTGTLGNIIVSGNSGFPVWRSAQDFYTYTNPIEITWTVISGVLRMSINHLNTAGNKHIPAGGSAGKILGWASDGTATWIDTGSGDPTSLGDLTDVTLTSPASGDILQFDGSVWVNVAGGGGGTNNYLTDVDFNTSSYLMTFSIEGLTNITESLSHIKDQHITEANFSYPTLTLTRAAGNLTANLAHTHNYDNYQNWLLSVSGVAGTATINSTNTVTFIPGNNISISRNGSSVTINATTSGGDMTVHTLGGSWHSNVDVGVDSADEGQLLRFNGTAWASWTPDFITSDKFLASLAFNTSTGDLTGTMSDASTVVVNLNGRYSLLGHYHPLATVGAAGFLRQLTNNTNHFLRADGNWAPVPSGDTSYTFTGSITENLTLVSLINDEVSPTANKYYGTNSSATRGYHLLSPMSNPHDLILGGTGGVMTNLSRKLDNGLWVLTQLKDESSYTTNWTKIVAEHLLIPAQSLIGNPTNELGVGLDISIGDGLEFDGSVLRATAVGGASLELDPVTSTISGFTVKLTAGETLTKGQACYMSAGKMYRGNASAEATSSCFAVAAESIPTDAIGEFLLNGMIGGFSGLTVGAMVYLSTSVGAFTQTAPSGSGHNIQILGVAVSATHIYFKPELTQIELI